MLELDGVLTLSVDRMTSQAIDNRPAGKGVV